ncbi:MAG: hypothetical protein NW218_10195 [Saprospiraceae bacterium]|nr:hypothetical protein [Saprospiraceae bacterium]
MFEYRFRVEKMRREQLLEVVAGTLQGPYEGYPSFQTGNGTTEQILDNLTDERGEVDLSTLQVYLDRLYQEDLERQTTQNRDIILFDADLVGANKLQNVLADFLDRQLQTVNRQLQVKDTDSGKNPALQVLFKLVTDQGTKQNHSAKEVFDLLSMGSQGQSFEQVELTLELLAGTDIRILNRHRSSKTKEERFELVHDRLAEQVFAKFNADELAQREARTTLTNKEKRSVTNKEYLSKGELELVGRSLNLDLLERNLHVFYDRSVAYHIRRERRQRWITFGAVLAAFVFALVAMVAYWQTQVAEVAKSNAESRLRSSQAFQILPFDPTRAKTLADSAYSTNPDFYALSALLNVQYRDIYNFRDSLFTNPFYTHLTEHTRKVFGVSFSPDGRFFATTSDDTTLIVWHTATKKLAASYKLEAVSKSISFHPDGMRMVVGMIWPPYHVKVLRFSERTGTISEVWRLPGEGHAIQNAQFSKDGKSLLINYDTGNLAILNAYSYKIQSTIPVRYGRSIKANFSPDGRLIMVSYEDSTVGIWNLNGILQKRLFFNARMEGVAVSEDNKYLFCGQQNGDILILDWQSPTHNLLYQRYEAHSSGISSLNLFHQDHYLLSSSYDGNTIVWEWNSALKSLKRVVTLNCGKNNPINDAAVAPNGHTVVSTAFDKSVYLWQLNDKPLGTLYTDDYLINFGVSPVEARLPFKYACANEYGITLLDSLGVLLKEYAFEDNNEALSIAISIDGKILVGTRNEKAILFNADLQAVRILNHTGIVEYVTFSKDGKYMLTASYDSTACLWTSDGKHIQTFKHASPVLSANFSPDEKFVLTGSLNEKVGRVWTREGVCIATLKGHYMGVRDVKMSPKEDLIATAGRDGTVRLWKLDGTPIRTFKGHINYVNTVIFSEDGQFIISGSTDNTIRIWSLDGTELATLKQNRIPVFALFFDKVHQRIISATMDGKINFWEINPFQLMSAKKPPNQ